jgi:hypothetical protein
VLLEIWSSTRHKRQTFKMEGFDDTANASAASGNTDRGPKRKREDARPARKRIKLCSPKADEDK